MNNSELSIHFNMSRGWLGCLKCTNRKKYDYIFSFDKYNRLNSINKYNIYVRDLINKVIDIYYSYDKPYHFAKWLFANKLYSYILCAQSIEIVLFTNHDNYLHTRLSVIDKLENIILYHYVEEL